MIHTLRTCSIGFMMLVAASLSAAETLNLVPWPKSLTMGQGVIELRSGARIMAQTAQLEPLAKVVAGEIYARTGLKLSTAVGAGGKGDISLSLSDAVKAEEGYILSVGSNGMAVEAKTYRGAAWGTVTLFQAIKSNGGKFTVPQMTIADEPSAEYRGLLIDVARKHHPIETMRSIVSLCRMYKINYLQIHINDNAGIMAFPFKSYPQLNTTKSGKPTTWTLEEVTALVKYADDRGVSIVPELEGPGHHAGNVRELCGREGIIDVYNEKTYEIIEALVKDLCAVFTSTPYLHIGGDEVGGAAGKLGKTPEEIAYKEKHKAGGVTQHYIDRVSTIVKKHGKKPMCWEGASGGVPKDVIFMPFDSHINANQYIAKGYKVINTAWKPLYVVGGTKFPADYIYDKWNMWLWQSHVNERVNVQVKEGSPDVLGAQMCTWEQAAEIELSSTRERIHAMSERIWNPKLGRTYTDFAPRAKTTDALLDTMLYAPVAETEGLPGPGKGGYAYFSNPIKLTLSAPSIGTIRYSMDGKNPTGASLAYSGPIAISKENTKVERLFYDKRKGRFMEEGPVVTVRAGLFDATGRLMGDETTVRRYWYKTSEELGALGKVDK